MVVFDASVLLLLLDPDASPPVDPATGKPVARTRERIEFLISTLDKSRTRILIPTPALSEILIRAGDAGPAYLNEMNSNACFRIVDFDQRAAVEAAAAHRAAIEQGDKREGTGAAWAKVKFDRQIIAIARVEGATTIYSDDQDIKKLAARSNVKVLGIAELPLPPEDCQGRLDLQSPKTPS